MKISLKSADGRVFEVTKAVTKQLQQLRTMMDAYEECEMTEPILLDRVDGAILAVIIEWCQAFPGTGYYDYVLRLGTKLSLPTTSSYFSSFVMRFMKVKPPTLQMLRTLNLVSSSSPELI